MFALPNIWRFISLSRLILPSTGPELQCTGEAGVHSLPITVEVPTEASEFWWTGVWDVGNPFFELSPATFADQHHDALRQPPA